MLPALFEQQSFMEMDIFEAKKVDQIFSYSTIHLSFCNVDFGVIHQKRFSSL
jgi:hypothetical protein